MKYLGKPWLSEGGESKKEEFLLQKLPRNNKSDILQSSVSNEDTVKDLTPLTVTESSNNDKNDYSETLDSFTTATATCTSPSPTSTHSFFNPNKTFNSTKAKTLTLPLRKRSKSKDISTNSSNSSHIKSSSFSSFSLNSKEPNPQINDNLKKVTFNKIWKFKLNQEIKNYQKSKSKSKKPSQALSHFLETVEISKPYNFEHCLKVTYDANLLIFNNLPSNWKKNENSNLYFNSSILSSPRVTVNGYKSRIPNLLVKLLEIIIKLNGFKQEGIFRISCNKLEFNKFKEIIENNNFNINEINNIHLVSNLIKQYFRQLEPKLLDSLPKKYFIQFGENEKEEKVEGEESKKKESDEMEKVLEEVIEPNKSIFLWLLDLMKEVVKEKEFNRMSIKNLAIIMTPNLFSFDNLTPLETLQISQKAVQLIAKLIQWRCDQNK